MDSGCGQAARWHWRGYPVHNSCRYEICPTLYGYSGAAASTVLMWVDTQGH